MNAMTTFEFEGDPLRVETSGAGEIIFNGKDACRLLGIEKRENAFGRLDDDEKVTRSTGTLGGDQMMVWLREAGLYRLIFESRKPEAEAFKRWVFHEVLPQIRQTGSYGKLPAMDLPDLAVLARTCDAVRRIHGRSAAKRIWSEMGGPDVAVVEAAIPSRAITDHQADLMPFVRDFLAECCEEDEIARVQARELYSAYRRWAQAGSSPAMTETAFGRTMILIGREREDGRIRTYKGLRLRALVRRQLGI